MKSLRLFLNFTAMLIFATSFTGKAYAFVNVIVMEIPMRSILQITANNPVMASIFIYDEKKTILFTDRFDSNSSSTKVFDFTNLNDGVYTMQSFSDLMNITKKIEVNDSKVEILSKETEYKPYFEIEGNELRVNFFNQDMEEIHFSLESNDRIFYNSMGKESFTFQKQIDISNLLYGEYYAILKVGAKTFYHNFFKN